MPKTQLNSNDEPTQNLAELDSQLPHPKPPSEPRNRPSDKKFLFQPHTLIKKSPHTLFPQKYTLLQKIGQGSFGQVYKIYHKHLHLIRALKIIQKSPSFSHPSSPSPSSLPLTLHDTYQQLQILTKLDHPNILKIYEYYESYENWYIVMEYFQGKELFDVIVGNTQKDKDKDKDKEKKDMGQWKGANIFREVVKAIAYIHSHGIVHRDIKPENVMVRYEGKEGREEEEGEYVVKVIDWGLGAITAMPLMRRCGTPQYCAPEIVEGLPYGKECDLWSLGVLLYVMLVGRFPFKGKTVRQTLQAVSKANLTFKSPQWAQISIQAKYLISQLIVKNPSNRLQATEILKSQWLLSNSNPCTPPSSLPQTLLHLKSFTLSNKLHSVVLHLIHNSLQSSHKQSLLTKQFQSLDTDNNGVLSFSQLLEGYRRIYPQMQLKQLEELVQEIFQNLDMDGNGQIAYSEFVTFATRVKRGFSQEMLKEVFEMMDQDGNGEIDRREIGKILKYERDWGDRGRGLRGLGEIDMQFDKIIEDIDVDGDGSIDLKEFIKSVTAAVKKSVKKESRILKQQYKRKKNSESKQKNKQSKQSKNDSSDSVQKRLTRQSIKKQKQHKSTKQTKNTRHQSSKSKDKDKQQKKRITETETKSQITESESQYKQNEKKVNSKTKQKSRSKPKPQSRQKRLTIQKQNKTKSKSKSNQKEKQKQPSKPGQKPKSKPKSKSKSKDK